MLCFNKSYRVAGQTVRFPCLCIDLADIQRLSPGSVALCGARMIHQGEPAAPPLAPHRLFQAVIQLLQLEDRRLLLGVLQVSGETVSRLVGLSAAGWCLDLVSCLFCACLLVDARGSILLVIGSRTSRRCYALQERILCRVAVPAAFLCLT